MAKIDAEILQVIGGQFHIAALGPEAVADLEGKIQRRPGNYLSAFSRLEMGDAFDPKRHADLHIVTLLRILQQARPEEVAAITRTLMRLYDGVLIPFDAAADRAKLAEILDEETLNLLFRLNTRRLELRAFVKGIESQNGELRE